APPTRPWEKPTEPDKPTPARVRRGFRYLRMKTGSPAGAPTPARPGPGRPPGSKNQRPAPRHDVGRVSPPVRQTPDQPTTRSTPSPSPAAAPESPPS
ncbi:hypothetical protein AB0F45_36120, partial [Streptomyces achromogenes]